MEMEDQYNMSDLRQLMNGGGSRVHFPSIPLQPATELFPSHRVPPLTALPAHHHQQHHHYEQLMMMGRPQPHDHHIINPRGLHPHEFRSPDSAAGGGAAANSATVTASLSGGGGLMEAEAGGDIGGSGRWPRQETLTLLEIRSRLDFKFKEANQKGPLWDEVSRIMCEEHGYQRSGKKCREKFENLYKYYKKTKEGKAGRQDGKNYRFFRQLEALYGETTNSVVSTSLPEAHFIGNNNNLRYQTTINAQANQEITTPYHHSTDQKHCDSLSLSNSSEFDTSSSEDQDNNDVSAAAMDDDSPDIKTMRKRRGGRGWKVKIKEFIDAQMRKLMEKQEEWLERLMRTLEQKERERMVREEEWRKQEVERIEKEHKFWAKERAWIEARDKALMEALHKLTGGSSSTDQAKANYSSPSPDHEHDQHHHHHHQTSSDHDQIVHNISSARELLNKKRKENVNSKSSACYFQNNESCSSLYTSQGGYCAEMNDHEQGGNNDGSNNSPCGNTNVGNAVQDNCFPFLMSEGENLWENYGLKLSKGSQNQ